MRKILSWAAVILWMLLIFKLSSQAAVKSDYLSKGVTKVIIETVKKIVPDANFDMDEFNHIVRKNAHFFAYLVLGVLTANALKTSGKNGGVYGYKFLALLICVLYASSDEIHQIFVPGRGPAVRDVFIDSAGAIIGIFIYFLGNRKKLSNADSVKMKDKSIV